MPPLATPCSAAHRAVTRAGGRLCAFVLAGLATATLAHAAAAADSLAARGAPPLPPARVRAWQTGLLRADRLEHASLSFTLAAGAGCAGATRSEALGFTLALGVLKELRDARSDRFDPLDLAADACGATLGSLAGARR